MSDQEALLQEMYNAVIEGDAERAKNAALKSIEQEIPPLTSIDKGLTPGIREVGERFGRLEMFLPEMVLSARAMEAAVAVLEPHLGDAQRAKKGRVMIGTVKGDIHDIGKNIAIALFRVNGYEVFDLGRDVALDEFIAKAQEWNADIIGMSGLLTTSLPLMRDALEILVEDGVRERFKVIIGGGPTSQEFADQIGADAYAENAAKGVEICNAWMGVEG